MKASNYTSRFLAAWVLMATLLFAACSDSSDIVSNEVMPASADQSFAVVLKALNAEGEDITTKGEVSCATLFVFDEYNDFVKEISVDEATLLQRRTVLIDCPETDRITVVAWGGLSGGQASVSAMTKASIISDLQVSLKQTNGVAASASDLFYGHTTVGRSSTKSAGQELKIARKVSSLSLTTRNLVKKFGSTEGSYLYKVKKTQSAFDSNGELTGREVEYVFPASFDEKGCLVSATTPIFPASEITVELYRNGELLFSVQNDQNHNSLSVNAGKQVNVVFSGTSQKEAEVVVTPWNSVLQYVTVD